MIDIGKKDNKGNTEGLLQNSLKNRERDAWSKAPMPPMMPPQAPMGQPGMQASSPIAAQYLGVTSKLIPSITERNPYLKERVGEAIFPFIKNLVGNDRVPKITGMLIELPVEQIKQYMCSYENLCCKVKEADDLINQSESQK